MKRCPKGSSVCCVPSEGTVPASLIVAVVVSATAAWGQSIDWYRGGAPGGESAAEGYRLRGSAGQAEASTTSESSYRVVGGFWQALASQIGAGEPTVVTSVGISPSQGIAGSTLAVQGQTVAGASAVRVLWKTPTGSTAIQDGPVAADGSFAFACVVPSWATPGAVQLGAQPLPKTLNATTAWVSFTVLPTPPGGINGTATLPAGPAANLGVTLFDPKGLPVGSTTTDAAGKFNFSDLAPGDYVVSVDSPKLGPGLVKAKPGTSQNVDVSQSPFQLPPVFVDSIGAVALPGGLLFGGKPVRVGDPWSPVFARLASFKGKGLQPLTVRFWAAIRKGAVSPDLPLFVRFELVDKFKVVAASPLVTSTNLVYSQAPYNFPAFFADFNSVELPPGPLKLRIIAYSGLTKVSQWSYPLDIVDLGSRWKSGRAQVNLITAVNHSPEEIRYNFTGNLPTSAIEWSEEVIGFDNQLLLGVPISEKFYTGGGFTGSAKAVALLELMGVTFLDEEVAYHPPSGTSVANATYQLPTVSRTFLEKFCRPIPGIGFKAEACIDYYFGEECAGISFGAQFCLEGTLYVDSLIKKDLTLTVTTTPAITASLPIGVQVDLVVCSASGIVEPAAQLKLPIYYDPDRSPEVGFEDPCVKLSAVAYYHVSCLGIKLLGGEKDLGSKNYGCKTGLAPQSGPVPQGPPPAGTYPKLPQTTVAVSPTGQALALWLPSESELPPGATVYKPYWKQLENGVWSEPAPLYPGTAAGSHPQVAYLGTRALAVWVDHALDATADCTNASCLANLNLRYAVWDGAAWSAPMALTEDALIDNRPTLAADPTTGNAMLVWLRESSPRPAGHRALALHYAVFNGTSWTAPARVAPTSTALDFQSSVCFDRSGVPHVVWTRDQDGQTLTQEDRQLMLASFDGAAWNVPSPIPGLPQAPWTPSLAFDLGNRPIVSFVSPLLNQETGSLFGPNGNQCALYCAWRPGADWVVSSVGNGLTAEAPVLRVNPDNQAVLMFRCFAGCDRGHLSGDLAAAVAELNPPALDWKTGLLTEDGAWNWDVAFDVDRNSGANVLHWQKTFTVRNAPSTTSMSARRMPHRPDAAFARTDPLRVSNRYPAAGEPVTVSAEVQNLGIRPIPAGSLVVRFYDEPRRPGVTPFVQVEVTNRLAFQDSTILSVPYQARTTTPRRITVVLDETETLDELDELNNIASVPFGGTPPPSNFGARIAPDASAILLDWDASAPPGAEYTIYRAEEGSARFEPVGSSTTGAFADRLAVAGRSYRYQIVAADGEGLSNAPTTSLLELAPSPIPLDTLDPVIEAVLHDGLLTMNWTGALPAILEESSELAGAQTRWFPVPVSPAVSAGITQFTLPAVQSARFYRLVFQ